MNPENTDDTEKTLVKKNSMFCSEEQNILYKRFQDASTILTVESISINKLVKEINEKILFMTQRRLVLEAKRNVIG